MLRRPVRAVAPAVSVTVAAIMPPTVAAAIAAAVPPAIAAAVSVSAIPAAVSAALARLVGWLSPGLAVDRLAESVHLIERLIGRRLRRAQQTGPELGQEDRVASQDLTEAWAIRIGQLGAVSPSSNR